MLALLLVAGGAWLVFPFWRLSIQFGERLLEQPTRVYGRPRVLRRGALLERRELTADLDALGYRRVESRLAPGTYRLGAGSLEAELEPWPRADGMDPGGRLEVRWRGSRLVELRWRGEAVAEAELPPPLLASLYAADMKERRPLRLEEVPEPVIHAVLAAEDAGFYSHPGLSFHGILRAAWADLRGRAIRQGGSTLTQQLVKTLYLSRERTWTRKLREAVLALLLETRYDKREILQAYLNEVYWGQSGPVSIVGLGAAAWRYFGKSAAELDVAEAALLAGMLPAPSTYDPLRSPEAALARRDRVLGRMAEQGWLDEAALAAALKSRLALRPQPVIRRRAPYFVDAVLEEARQRFGLGRLENRGFILLTTLDWGLQRQAEEAVAWGLAALERGWEKGRKRSGPLQAALVALAPESGAVLAYVGGRDYGASQFDRAGAARRQAGSAFKPVVYAAAFEAGGTSPASLIEDGPLTVRLAGRTWSPHNADNKYRGPVSARRALEQSLNVPTARLALEVGLDEVVETARRLGIESPLEPYPSLALGAFEVTPLELATVYATLAAGGMRPGVHRLEAVLDPRGVPVVGKAPPAPRRAVSPQVSFLLTSILEGVLDQGTARTAREQGVYDRLAGKTGTTNGGRDSWFAGYGAERATLVWVGYDGNDATRLSGSRAALPIWSRFTVRTRPVGGYAVVRQPAGIVTALIDPRSGELATAVCPERVVEYFRSDRAPDRPCRLHGGWLAEREREREEARGPFRRWWKKLFGRHRGGGG